MMQEAFPSFTWLNPTRVIFGAGKLSELCGVVNDVSDTSSNVFLVTGRSNLKRQGILPKVMEQIGAERITLFDRVMPFPAPDVVDEATTICRKASCEVVVAIGGGSALDLAKAVAILINNPGSARAYALREKTMQNRGLPFVAVLTTSGSSSEVTSAAALWDMDAKRHMGLSHPFMFPTVAIVDPELALSMSGHLAAVTGMDAFTSAFESYWSNDAGPIADAIDLEVIRLYAGQLDRSCRQGDLASRTMCALAATMSGMAYSNSHPNVCHAVGTPLTTYWGVEHGQAVGITLAAFLRWNAPAISHKLPALWSALGIDDLDGAVAKITRIMTRCGLKTTLSELGIRALDMDTLVENVRWDRVVLSPRPYGKEDAHHMMSELL